MTSPCLDLEIGITIPALMNLRSRGIPDCTSWQYAPYSRVEVGGDGRPRGFGFPTASWSWEVLSQDQLNALLDFFAADSDASVVVTIRTYVDVGHGLGSMIGRFQAIMARPVDGAGKSLINDSRTPVFSDVSVAFSHLVIV